MLADFISKTTGKVVLRVQLTTEQKDCLDEHETQEMCTLVDSFRKECKNKIDAWGKTRVITTRVTVDTYESSLFWYMLLFRPILIEGTEETCSIYEMMQDPDKAAIIARSDLGVFWDRKNNYLVVIWKEAQEHGALEGWEACPSWKEACTDFNRRRVGIGRMTNGELQRRFAVSSNYVVNHRVLHNMKYTQKNLFFVERRLASDDYTVFDLAGIEAPKYDVAGSTALPTPKFARLAPRIACDRTEARVIKYDKREENKKRRQRDAEELERRAQRARLRYQHEHHDNVTKEYIEASRIVQRLPAELGVQLSKRGRPMNVLNGEQSDRLFSRMLRAYRNGEYNGEVIGTPARAYELLDALEKLIVSSDAIPGAFRRWLDVRTMSLAELSEDTHDN